MTEHTLQARLSLTIKIAEEAGQMIINAREQQGFSQRLKKDNELVTDVDVAVDKLISQRLEEHFPGEARLSEELAPESALHVEAPQLWVVDPIDGTVNFAQGLRHVAVSIGWMEDGVAKVGVVHAPFLGETFSAAEGCGSFCNGHPIKPSDADVLGSTLVGTGFPYRKEARKRLLKRLDAVLTHCQDIRRNGAAALDICDVACGRLDAYYETVSPWDFVAGWVIAREAGASVGHLYQVPSSVPVDLYPDNLLVTAPGVHDAMRQLLLEADQT
ncbi:MAG: inositol monophosphatase [Halomonas sp.]|nr:inositol monophosphatase family protein [Halomonas sp.]TVP45763.1 MAG: inositol monophosphatase [Halomonas sp.]